MHGIIASHAVIVPPAYADMLPVQIVQYLRDFERTAELVKKPHLVYRRAERSLIL